MGGPSKVTQEEKTRRNAQDGDDEVDRSWTAAHEWTTKNIEVFGGQRSLESQHWRIVGAGPVSKRVERQHSAHCEAGEK